MDLDTYLLFNIINGIAIFYKLVQRKNSLTVNELEPIIFGDRSTGVQVFVQRKNIS
jgi:hypothetical protein